MMPLEARASFSVSWNLKCVVRANMAMVANCESWADPMRNIAQVADALAVARQSLLAPARCLT